MPSGAVQPCLPELLVPAGNEEALRAAIANGADAVYFGLEDFNARRRATNFRLGELPSLVRRIHDHNVRAYLTLNTLIFPGELDRAAGYVAAAAEAGVDAIIVQDLGLLRLARAMCPTLPIHASTQTTQTHPAGIGLLASLGVRRVILARELSWRQVADIVRQTSIELEVFVHGALCISFSGQCLASQAWWGRSANRGECAQVCRLPWGLSLGGRRADTGDRGYLMSPRDLSAAELLPRLIDIGVAALKIEGRLKSAAYVAAATRTYRDLIDRIARGERAGLDPRARERLTLSFSRGFTSGFLGGDRAGLVDGRFPRSRGLLLGHVEGTSPRRVIIRLTAADLSDRLKPGDGIVFDTGRPDAPEQGGRVYDVQALPGRAPRVAVGLGWGDVDIPSVPRGCRVWKTDDPTLRRSLERSGRRRGAVRREKLHVEIRAGAGRPLRIRFHDQAGHEVEVSSEDPMPPAARHGLTPALLGEQLGRLGGTPYELGTVTLCGSDGPADCVDVMVPKSLLNRMRREAIVRLLEAREAAARREVERPEALSEARAALSRADPVVAPPRWSVLVRSAGQLAAVLEWCRGAADPPAMVHVEAGCGEPSQVVAAVRANGRAVSLATTQVLMPGEEGWVEALADAGPDALLVRSLAAGVLLRRRAPGLTQVADHTLNAVNELSADVLREAGFARVTPGYDADASQLARLAAACPGVELELIVHARVPLFHTSYCPVSAAVDGGAGCDACGRPCIGGQARLRDYRGREQALRVDPAGRTTVFDVTVQSAAARWDRIGVLRPAWMRVELFDETAAEVCEVLGLYADLFAGLRPAADVLRRLTKLYPAGVGPGTLARRRPSN